MTMKFDFGSSGAARPRVPLEVTVDFMRGYIGREHPDVQLSIIMNLLTIWMINHVPMDQYHEFGKEIHRILPEAVAVVAPTVGGTQ